VATALEKRTRPAKYLDGHLASAPELRRWMAEPLSFWPSVHGWEPARDRQRVLEELGRLRAYVSRLGLRLYVVNLPESTVVRELYSPGRYEQYLELVREGVAGTPFLDLRTFLRDDEFFDESHPTWSGARRLSAAVGAFVADHARARDEARQ
jgi:hypothetical protein